MKECKQCKVQISDNKKYCSDKCKEKYKYDTTPYIKNCSVCKNVFLGKKGTKTCSPECKLKSQKLYKKVCLVCKNKFNARGNGLYCSDVCYRTANSTTKGLIVLRCEVCHNNFQTLRTSSDVVCSDKCGSKLFSTYIVKANREVFGTSNKVEIRRMVSEGRIPTWEEKQARILR